MKGWVVSSSSGGAEGGWKKVVTEKWKLIYKTANFDTDSPLKKAALRPKV